MSDPKVTPVVWRDAKADPPNHGSPVLVDFGLPEHSSGVHRSYLSYWEGAWGRWLNGVPEAWRGPDPSVWCDPTPPSEDALTLADLRRVLERADRDLGGHPSDPDDRKAIARLRAALPKGAP